MAADYTVRYAHINAHKVTHRLVENPNYSGSLCEVPGCRVVPVIERVMKPKFFKALKDDVRVHGFRNPVLVYATKEFGNLLSFGGSRLRIGRQLDIEVPAIVVDYTGVYRLSPEVTPENWQGFFLDVPKLFEFTSIGVETHYSIERNRREWFDPAGVEWFKGIDEDFVEEEFPWLLDISLKSGRWVREGKK